MSCNLGLLDEVDVALAQPSPVRLLVDVALNEVFSVKEPLHQLDICSKQDFENPIISLNHNQ